MMLSWLLVPAGYLIGTFPTAYLFGKKLKGIDIRKAGDRNMGARNAYFEIGHKAGILIAVIDALKGLLAVLIAQWCGAPQSIVLWTGVAVVLGHNFPFFLRFRGGRGEAATIGILLAVIPVPVLIVGPIAILCLLVFKNVILASAVFYIGLVLACLLTGIAALLIFYEIGLAVMVALTHLFRVVFVRKPAVIN
jgi:acyl phosphate:glycerol-3-phosphate acyltransferase